MDQLLFRMAAGVQRYMIFDNLVTCKTSSLLLTLAYIDISRSPCPAFLVFAAAAEGSNQEQGTLTIAGVALEKSITWVPPGYLARGSSTILCWILQSDRYISYQHRFMVLEVVVIMTGLVVFFYAL